MCAYLRVCVYVYICVYLSAGQRRVCLPPITRTLRRIEQPPHQLRHNDSLTVALSAAAGSVPLAGNGIEEGHLPAELPTDHLSTTVLYARRSLGVGTTQFTVGSGTSAVLIPRSAAAVGRWRNSVLLRAQSV
jgi:hypothetical protein